MTRPVNNAAKSSQEYLSVVSSQPVEMLIIRLTAGMDALAHEMGNGQRQYEQQWEDPHTVYSPAMLPLRFRPYEFEQVSPLIYPPYFNCSPSPGVPSTVEGLPFACSPHLMAMQRERVQSWHMDGTSAYPMLVIEASRVKFYAAHDELNAAIAERGPNDASIIYLNLAHVVTVEKVLAQRVYTQELSFADVDVGTGQQVPPLALTPLSISVPATLPVPIHVTDEMMFQIVATGGQAPYRYALVGQPSDVYVTTDGWVRGFIDDNVWPLSGHREFLIRIMVQDSAIPRATSIMDYRFRLAPPL